MMINLITSVFAATHDKVRSRILAVVGSVLGVLQIALAVQMLVLAGQLIGLRPPSAESTKLALSFKNIFRPKSNICDHFVNHLILIPYFSAK
jgi:hypothetical protein